MFRLIIKDLTFNKLQVFLGLLVVVLSTLFILVERQYVVIPFIMAPSFLFIQIVGKGCYLDDKNSVYSFLRSLPIPKNTIVLSKYVESILVLAISYTIIFGSNLVLMYFGRTLFQFDTLLLMVISLLLIYFAIFLYMFFRYDYSSTQQTSFIIIIIWIGIIKLQQYINSSGLALTRILHVDILYLLLMIAIVIFAVSYTLSARNFGMKE